MREILRTNDPVLLSAVEALLRGAGLLPLILDQNMSVLEGSLGFLQRRLVVADDEEQIARQILHEAGLGHELRPDES